MKKYIIIALAAITILFGLASVSRAVDAGTSDIQITANNLTITPLTIKEGTTVTFKAKVENKGAIDATQILVKFFINEKGIGEKTLNKIVKEKTSTATLTYKIPVGMVGEQKLRVVISNKTTVGQESSVGNFLNIEESKNQAEKTFIVLPPPSSIPDLSISANDLKITPTNYKGGDKITLKATIVNNGIAKITDVKIKFFFNEVEVYSKNITSISKQGKSVINYQYTLPLNFSGKAIFKAVADPDNTIEESNEKNNVAEMTANVNPAQIDLVIDSVKTSNSKPKVGQKVSIQVKVKNNGNTKAINVKLNVYLGSNTSTPDFTLNIPSINKNVVSSKSFSWTIPNNISGTNYPIRAVVDQANTIIETNELNNEKIYLLNLAAPDLAITYLGQSAPRFTYAGLNSTMNVRITNNNVVPIQNVKVGLFYYLPGETNNLIKIGEENVGPIVKNSYKDAFLSGKIPTSISIGTTIGFVAKLDYDDAIPETNETNNKLEYLIPIIAQPQQLSCPCLYILVNNEEGNPLNGATVKLNNSESKITGEDKARAGNGYVIFENRPNSADYSLSITYPSYRSISQTLNYNKNNEENTYFNYQLDTRAQLSGQVKNIAGNPLSWTNVRVEGTGLETVTDAQGKYGFLLNGGSYTIRFSHEGYNRIIESNYVVAPLSTQTLDKTMAPGITAYFSGRVTDDEGNGLNNTDIYVNDTMLGTTAADGHFHLDINAGNNKKFTIKKPTFVNTEFTETIIAGNEYNYDLVMYKPSTANHVERGTNIVSWHQHEGTPGNAFFIPEYNVDIWWGLGHTKMGLDFTKSNDITKISKLVINVRGDNWECNRVEGEGSVETSAIDIPLTIAAGSCSTKKTQIDVYKVSIESGGQEIWNDDSFWSSASDPMNSKSKVFTFDNIPVTWDNNLKVKMWIRVQKKAVVGTDGDGAGALSGYHMDKKLITWYPQKPPTTKISTSWKQVGGYFLGILDNPVNVVTGFTDIFTIDQFEQYTMEEVLPQNFPGSPPAY